MYVPPRKTIDHENIDFFSGPLNFGPYIYNIVIIT